MSKIALHREDPRVLVVSGPAHGDILLATPLITALRRAWPAATLDVLVYTGQTGILEGNPDVDEVLTASKHPRAGEYARLLRHILRRYDLAISTKQTDRVLWYVFLAGRRRIAVVPADRDAWKRRITQGFVPHDPEGTHTLLQNGALAGLLGIPFSPEIRLPRPADDPPSAPAAGARPAGGLADVVSAAGQAPTEGPYAVVHATPGLPYKRWTRAGWTAVAAFLQEHGLTVVLTGGGSGDELEYVSDIAAGLPAPAINLAGKLRFAELTGVLERCSVYVGADTVATHMAAVAGVPTVALFGPESPKIWGPWPRGYEDDMSPWRSAGEDVAAAEQQVGNVTVLQSAVACPTCRQGACLRRSQRREQCSLMKTLDSERVLAALARLPALSSSRNVPQPIPGGPAPADRPSPSL